MGDWAEQANTDNNAPPFILLDEFPTLVDAAEYLTQEALSRADGNQSIAAQLLGISRQALSKRLKRAESPLQ